MEDRERLRQAITQWRSARLSAQKLWSAVHHAALFGSVLCSIMAGVQIQILKETNAASVMTALAAVLTGIAASGGFERKWRSNRLSRSKADCLLIDLDDEEVDPGEIKRRFKSAIEKHDLEIIGEKKEEEPGQ